MFVLGLLVQAGVALADGRLVPAISMLVADAEHAPRDVLAGRAGDFEPMADGRFLLPGDAGRIYWIRLDVEFPATAGGQRHVLWLDRMPAREVRLHVPAGDGIHTLSRSFFAPSADEEILATGFAFELPEDLQGEVALLLEVQGRIALSTRPVIESRARYRSEERRAALALGSIYTSLLVLGLIGGALFIALRERVYLKYAGFVLLVLVLLLAVNGHLYGLPVFDWLAWWRESLLFALGHLAAMAMLVLVRHFASLDMHSPRIDALLRIAAWACLALALPGLANLQQWAGTYQWLSAVAWCVAGVACLAGALAAVRHRRPLAVPMLAIWATIILAACARALVPFGLVPQGTWTMYGFQVALAAGAFLLTIGLADRMMEFRKQRDRARLAKEQIDASLQVEQGRRRFAESLQAGLRDASNGDLEWVAFRRLLEALRPLLPQQGSAVVAFGYHGLDLLIAEPLGVKERYSRLLKARGGTLKGVCRSRNPVQVLLEGDGGSGPDDGGLFAVVPLRMDKPGWGALLVERAPWESFEPAELRLAAEFAEMASAASDEAFAARELRRKAELDSLTGAYNRHAMDAMLARMIADAHANRQPLSILFVDLDHFKQVNDRYGHAVGDLCLRRLAESIRHLIGPGDLFGRYGGEEFILVLPGQPPEQARALGERLRVVVSELRVGEGEEAVRFTVSIGVASRQQSEQAAQPIIDRADKALYTAKRSGRNQVQVAPSYGAPGTEADRLTLQ